MGWKLREAITDRKKRGARSGAMKYLNSQFSIPVGGANLTEEEYAERVGKTSVRSSLPLRSGIANGLRHGSPANVRKDQLDVLVANRNLNHPTRAQIAKLRLIQGNAKRA